MQTSRFFLLFGAPLLLPAASGCSLLLSAPPVDPIATPAPTPKAPFFDPVAGATQGTGKKLNVPGDLVLADAFRIAGALGGDRVTIQSVDTVTSGNPPKPTLVLGVPDRVRLAGIVAPTTEPALSLARKTISDWTAGRDVDVEQDAKYPTDLNGVRVVHIFYKGREKGAKGEPGPFAGQILSLNRMLVRSGNAVVDLYSPTAFDTSQWLLDEAYARRHRLGFWKFGIAVQQRIPVTATPKNTGTGARSRVSIQPTTLGEAPAAPADATGTITSTQTTTTATTTTGSTPVPGTGTGAPAAAAAPPTGGPTSP